MQYQSINPTTEELIASYDIHSDEEAENALARSWQAFCHWRKRPFEERAQLLTRVAEKLEGNVEVYSELMAHEMGKPIGQAVGEVRKCATVCRYFAEKGGDFLRNSPQAAEVTESAVYYEPLGPIVAIMPWNFPFWQVYRFGAPALMAGNVIILKHAPNTPQCALAIERLMREAGFPNGVFQSLFLSNAQAAELIADRRVRGVTLTGSTRAGREVANVAGKNLKKTVLELGGNDPFIVLDDVDLKKIIKIAVTARCQNNGQSCIAAKRFLVDKAISDQFCKMFVEEMNAQIVGDPIREDVTIGPLARRDLRDRLAEQVDNCVKVGAKVLCGGKVSTEKGFFYPPTVLLANQETSMEFIDEELFGPVATIIPFSTEKEAVSVANATCYGLGASIWTKDIERARQIIPEIEAGAVFVNNMVKSDPRFPVGGIKASGYGRELSREGMHEFVNIKTVWIQEQVEA